MSVIVLAVFTLIKTRLYSEVFFLLTSDPGFIVGDRAQTRTAGQHLPHSSSLVHLD